MIYWLKKLEWKIRKALGLRKTEKRIKTVANIQTFPKFELFKKLIILITVLIFMRIVGQTLASLWLWFFPRISRAPMRYL